jgi:hypothetical protein
MNTRFDYEHIRKNECPGWQQHWLNLLEGRFVVDNNELIDDPHARLYRLGFTVAEVEAATGHTGYTRRELEWYQAQPERYRLEGDGYAQVDGWQGQYDAHMLAIAIEDKRLEIQREKCSRRDAGLVIDGVKFDTDPNAQTMYTQYMVALLMDNTYTVPDWKASDGVFVLMDGALFTQIRAAWTEHISSITSRQKAKDAEVESLTTLTDVEAYEVNAGW